MVKYRMKDEALQKLLEKIFGKQLPQKLMSGMEVSDENLFEISTYIVGYFPNRNCRLTVAIRKDDVEKVYVYDSHTWNHYPEVTPPEHVAMRVETKSGEGYQAYFVDGNWRMIDLPNGDETALLPAIIDRFRPWVGPDEEDKE